MIKPNMKWSLESLDATKLRMVHYLYKVTMVVWH